MANRLRQSGPAQGLRLIVKRSLRLGGWATGTILFVSITSQFGLAQGDFTILPEYERTMELVLVSVPVAAASQGEGESDTIPTDYLYRTFAELMTAMPSYTEAIVVVSPQDRQRVAAILEKAAPERYVNLQVLRPSERGVELDMWAQDLGEPIVVDGVGRFLVSMEVEGVGPLNRAVSKARQTQSRHLFGDAVQIADFIFEAGNFVIDRTAERTRVLVGFNDISLTFEAYATRGDEIPDEVIYQKISKAFGGAEVVEMGLEIQSPYLRHLDQAFILLHGAVAIINTLGAEETEAEVEKRQLAQHRKELEALGYRVLTLSNTADELLSYFNSLNAVPFLDKDSNKRRVLFPVFPGEVEAGYDGKLDASTLRGKAKRAYDLYESVGYEPIPVRDFAYVAGGNTHCMVNVLQ